MGNFIFLQQAQVVFSFSFLPFGPAFFKTCFLQGEKQLAGNPAWKKGVCPNPNGRPKGSKNRLPALIVNRIMEVWDDLEATKGLKGKGKDGLPKDKSLGNLAKTNPEWFYRNFIKALLPKNIDIGVFTGEHYNEEDLTSLPDNILLEIVKDNLRKKQPVQRKAKVVNISGKKK